MEEQRTIIDEASTSDEYVLVVRGELDAASADSFADAAYSHLDTAKQLVVDLSSTSFMDSSGLKVLVTMAVARGGSGGVLVRNPCQQIRKLIRVSGTSHLVKVEPEQGPDVAIAS